MNPRRYPIDPLRYAWEGLNSAPYPIALANRWHSTPEGPQQGRRGRDIIVSLEATRHYDGRATRDSPSNLLRTSKLKHAAVPMP